MIVHLKRRATFSAAHNYWLTGLSEEENDRRFGRWAAREPHGHNYLVEVTVSGEVDPASGMVVNIADVNRSLKARVTDLLDGRFLNREIPYFEKRGPTVENISQFIWDSLEPSIPNAAQLSSVKLWESETLSSELFRKDGGEMISTLTRTYDFCASHRLHSPSLSDEENRAVFGKCNNPNGHGHNYEIAVTVAGTPDPQTGMILDLEELDRIVEDAVILPFDHKHLNLDTPEFAETNPTSEMLAIVIWQKLASRIPGAGSVKLHSILVSETPRNSFEYRG